MIDWFTVIAQIVNFLILVALLRYFLYGRIMDTLLATWGLSLFMVGMVTTLFGPQEAGVEAQLGKFQVGEYSISQYNLLLIGLAFLMLLFPFCLWRYTRFGLIVRGTMPCFSL